MVDAERDVRDRLAEVIFRELSPAGDVPWQLVHPRRREEWRQRIDNLLKCFPDVGLLPPEISALPTVGLRIGRVEE